MDNQYKVEAYCRDKQSILPVNGHSKWWCTKMEEMMNRNSKLSVKECYSKLWYKLEEEGRKISFEFLKNDIFVLEILNKKLYGKPYDILKTISKQKILFDKLFASETMLAHDKELEKKKAEKNSFIETYNPNNDKNANEFTFFNLMIKNEASNIYDRMKRGSVAEITHNSASNAVNAYTEDAELNVLNSIENVSPPKFRSEHKDPPLDLTHPMKIKSFIAPYFGNKEIEKAADNGLIASIFNLEASYLNFIEKHKINFRHLIFSDQPQKLSFLIKDKEQIEVAEISSSLDRHKMFVSPNTP